MKLISIQLKYFIIAGDTVSAKLKTGKLQMFGGKIRDPSSCQ